MADVLSLEKVSSKLFFLVSMGSIRAAFIIDLFDLVRQIRRGENLKNVMHLIALT